ncbi:hypothetical protein AVEN_82054-1 [Araneus ventricosus]|uniref:Uncharacterized protein n=1 Tax=Araneus ventricosus TaxID=182803 RepID=A0A4Y2T0V5_ARAVE|nr:hypothetical protein AVEN_82054-1 [Araneus ventricosus]
MNQRPDMPAWLHRFTGWPRYMLYAWIKAFNQSATGCYGYWFFVRCSQITGGISVETSPITGITSAVTPGTSCSEGKTAAPVCGDSRDKAGMFAYTVAKMERF